MAVLLKIYNIKSFKHEFFNFNLILNNFFKVNDCKKLIYAYIYYKTYLIYSLKANILFKNNIIALKSITIYSINIITFITSCNVCITNIIRQKN